MSRFGDLLRTDEFLVTSELLPPKGVDLSEPLRKAKRLLGIVDAFNVTDSHSAIMTQSPIALANALTRLGVDPIMQLTCRDRNRIALQADILAAATFGIENFLCLSGDNPQAGDHPDAKPVFDLDAIKLLKAASALVAKKDYGGNDLKDAPASLVLGAALTPGVPDLDKEIGRAEEKEAAGASFFQTQVVFDMTALDRYLARGGHIKVPILLGIFVLRSANMARRMSHLPGVTVPDSLVSELESAASPGEKGIEIASRLVREAKDRCHGVHIMALGWEHRIPEILERAGISRLPAQARP